MGIGNTSSHQVLAGILGQVPLEECVGRGAGLGDAQVSKQVRSDVYLGRVFRSINSLMSLRRLKSLLTCGAFYKRPRGT